MNLTINMFICKTASVKSKIYEIQIMADISIDNTGKFDFEYEVQFLKHFTLMNIDVSILTHLDFTTGEYTQITE